MAHVNDSRARCRGYRIRVVLDDLKDYRRKSYLYVNLNHDKNVRNILYRAWSIFFKDLCSGPGELIMTLGGFFIPPHEASVILEADDLVNIRIRSTVEETEVPLPSVAGPFVNSSSAQLTDSPVALVESVGVVLRRLKGVSDGQAAPQSETSRLKRVSDLLTTRTSSSDCSTADEETQPSLDDRTNQRQAVARTTHKLTEQHQSVVSAPLTPAHGSTSVKETSTFMNATYSDGKEPESLASDYYIDRNAGRCQDSVQKSTAQFECTPVNTGASISTKRTRSPSSSGDASSSEDSDESAERLAEPGGPREGAARRAVPDGNTVDAGSSVGNVVNTTADSVVDGAVLTTNRSDSDSSDDSDFSSDVASLTDIKTGAKLTAVSQHSSSNLQAQEQAAAVKKPPKRRRRRGVKHRRSLEAVPPPPPEHIITRVSSYVQRHGLPRAHIDRMKRASTVSLGWDTRPKNRHFAFDDQGNLLQDQSVVDRHSVPPQSHGEQQSMSQPHGEQQSRPQPHGDQQSMSQPHGEQQSRPQPHGEQRSSYSADASEKTDVRHADNGTEPLTNPSLNNSASSSLLRPEYLTQPSRPRQVCTLGMVPRGLRMAPQTRIQAPRRSEVISERTRAAVVSSHTDRSNISQSSDVTESVTEPCLDCLKDDDSSNPASTNSPAPGIRMDDVDVSNAHVNNCISRGNPIATHRTNIISRSPRGGNGVTVPIQTYIVRDDGQRVPVPVSNTEGDAQVFSLESLVGSGRRKPLVITRDRPSPGFSSCVQDCSTTMAPSPVSNNRRCPESRSMKYISDESILNYTGDSDVYENKSVVFDAIPGVHDGAISNSSCSVGSVNGVGSDRRHHKFAGAVDSITNCNVLNEVGQSRRLDKQRSRALGRPQTFLDESAHEKELIKDDRYYSLFPLLTSLAKQGDVIAFKRWDMREDYTPYVTEYLEARVLQLNGDGRLRLELLQTLPCVRRRGRFDMASEDDDEVVDLDDEAGIVDLQWQDIITPRLMLP